MDTCRFTYLAPRKLDGVIIKLKPLSEEYTLLKFLRNVDNAKILSGFVQELANAVGYYQVGTPCPAVIVNEYPDRFRYNKECMREQEGSTTKSGISMMILRTSLVIPGISLMI